ncbi:pyridoxal phosphate-dependent decarboxylase family protein [Pontimicrobium aquaticum]|uniref:Aminotransferase class V-fold PLP-dependent enzyme n=1 Tax=Pontimicrobium aquaticum TaxID=2565367 RepID=A0A4U0EW75_9FLAO|nr:aminotransferase class V-fold PLP-dependent enzyme [Pontimicrobium aquaticum]TJY36197.1 aminotransferase class V-fold PLP-dependent enzyme [Pontimicrobium aquaticum]
MSDSSKAFETLDPQDWEQSKALMHQMVEDAFDYVKNIRDRKIWQEMPEDVLKTFNSKLPQQPSDAETVYQELQQNVLPYPMGNVHPRFWAWYMGNGTISGVMGDFWASIINPNLGGGNHAGHKVEEQVVNWIKEIIEFPQTSSGLLVSGGSMANYAALAVARNVKAGYDIRKEGLKENNLVFYASTEIHSCNTKAVELLGLGTKGLKKIAVNDDYTINIESLKKQIAQDKASGLQPICIIGTSGTVNTGAIDDLNAIADICEQENLWFHVDGAIGAIAMLSNTLKPQLKGIERADSVALDLHKWLHMPFEAGCVIIKDNNSHKKTFSLIPEYLEKNTRGLASGENWFSEYGLQLSRRFRALKVWMSLKEHGSKRFGRMITRNVEQAFYLGDLVNNHNDLELLAPIGMDIVCFRYNPGEKSLDELNAINKEIKLQIEEQAIALPGYTTLNGAYCIRCAISSHRVTNNDFDVLIEHVLRIGKQLT